MAPAVAGHSAAVQRGLFSRLNDRRAGGRPASYLLAAQAAAAAAAVPIQPDQEDHVTGTEGEGVVKQSPHGSS